MVKDSFKRQDQLTQFFSKFFTSWFLCCDSNLDLQSNIPRLGVYLIDLTSFFLWKMLNIVLEYWKLSKLCCVIGKTFGLLGLYVILKVIISSLLVFFGCLKTSRCIFLALNMLAFISDLWYFCSRNVVFFSSLTRFYFTFSFSEMVHILLARENDIFIKQCRGCLDVNAAYCF